MADKIKKYRRSKADVLAYDNKYTEEEVKWLMFVDKWKTEENYGIWPTMTQILVLAKKFLKAAALFIVLCSVSFATVDLNNDCMVNWKDFPKGCNLKVYSVFANNWLKQDSMCIKKHELQDLQKKSQIVQKHYQEVLKSQSKYNRILVIGPK